MRVGIGEALRRASSDESGKQRDHPGRRGAPASNRMESRQRCERCKTEAADSKRSDLPDRNCVATDNEIIGGRDGRNGEEDRSCRQRKGVSHGRAFAAVALDDPAQTHDSRKRRDRRYHFLPNRDRQSAEKPRSGGIAWPRRHAREERQRPDQQHELHIVMMDGAGAEILQDRYHEHCENERKARRGMTGKFACKPRYSGQKHQQQSRRPYDQSEFFGKSCRDEQ